MAEGWTNGMHSAHRNHTDLLNHTYEGKTTDHRNEVVNQKENNNGGRTGHSHSLLRSGPGLLYRETELYHLQRQISQLQTYDKPQTHLRYESEAFVLHKRRNNLFRGLDKHPASKDTTVREERPLVLDTLLSRKKPISKNASKIQKLLNSFVLRGMAPAHATKFLQLVSQKHHIPLQISNRTVGQQHGYVLLQTTQKQSDIRRIKKYHINIYNMPPVGNVFDSERNEQLTRHIEDDICSTGGLQLYEEDVDCFESRHTEEGYVFGDMDRQFVDMKRDIFKGFHVLSRLRFERQSNLKKLAYLCVKEVQKRYCKCVKNQNDYVNRAKKLHRQCLIYWRKRQKELTQLKKKKQRLETELKKRDEEQQQAKKQQKRLQYIIHQSQLYSHFMATKLGVDAEQRKQLGKIEGERTVEIDEEAALLTVNQIITSKMDNLQKFDKKKQQKLDFSSVDQGSLEFVGTPVSFHGTLKEYQIKGLRWLNNLFEQGINGILADQMGLGKTIQAIALLSHISTTKNVWGPFLIVAPNSTLYNWQQQFKKFCPALKVLPYWGNIKQRKTIRKFFSSKKFTEKADSPFHVVITSYQLTVADQKTFKRLKWQFMILDQAQAIKNILSQRWNTLKQFQARNRLLLTGTPIQNNMAQLWALLNFVMPDLFDSHELFNQWFSKDIEAHSQDQKQLDQIKIQRLHAILKPFMLRRIKKDVEHQIGKKHQHQVLCEMTKRQKLLYDSIKEKLNVKELFKMYESKAKVQNLMNLVMQLRKVCNHPELFERRPARSPFLFQQVYYYTGYIPIRSGDIKLISFASQNPIHYNLPILIYDQLLRYTEHPLKRNRRLLNIFSVNNQINNKTFSPLALTVLSMSQIQFCFTQDLLYTGIILLHWLNRNPYSSTLSTGHRLNILTNTCYNHLPKKCHIRSFHNIFIPDVVAPAIQTHISSISYVQYMEFIRNNRFQKFIMEGKYRKEMAHYLPKQMRENYCGVISCLDSLARIQVIDFGNLIADSSKLKQLDKILKIKKQKGDKILIFCQMTKMIDILEDFMNLRKYTFFRLDGASNIADRRDMVNDFQKPNSKIFVFLLSTRAGGLGVTLTAANTVIFYDNDWNPTMDAQATDRAHRIGQNRDVNVYQLVTKGTIEERIVKRAQQKKTVQSTVYEGASSFNFFKRDILDLMADEFDANVDERLKKEPQNKKKPGKRQKEEGNDQKAKQAQKHPEMVPSKTDSEHHQ